MKLCQGLSIMLYKNSARLPRMLITLNQKLLNFHILFSFNEWTRFIVRNTNKGFIVYRYIVPSSTSSKIFFYQGSANVVLILHCKTTKKNLLNLQISQKMMQMFRSDGLETTRLIMALLMVSSIIKAYSILGLSIL